MNIAEGVKRFIELFKTGQHACIHSDQDDWSLHHWRSMHQHQQALALQDRLSKPDGYFGRVWSPVGKGDADV